MHEAWHSKLVFWDNPEGWGGDRGEKGIQDWGTYVHPWLIHVNIWQKLLKKFRKNWIPEVL